MALFRSMDLARQSRRHAVPQETKRTVVLFVNRDYGEVKAALPRGAEF